MKVTKQEIFTIPNILSFTRILMIPAIVALYYVYEEYIMATVLCLSLRYPYMIWMFVKELIMGITGALSIKYSGNVHGADWHGKVVTVLLYAMMVLHLVWFDMPLEVSNVILLVCAAMMILSLVLYTLHNVRRIQAGRKQE